jgi:hypothetical protein
MAGGDQSCGMFAVIIRWRNDHRRVTNTGIGQFVDGGKDGNMNSNLIAKTVRATGLEIGDSGKLAGLRVAREFMQMKSMDASHASQSGKGDF